jgi:hypothetical protein
MNLGEFDECGALRFVVGRRIDPRVYGISRTSEGVNSSDTEAHDKPADRGQKL